MKGHCVAPIYSNGETKTLAVPPLLEVALVQRSWDLVQRPIAVFQDTRYLQFSATETDGAIVMPELAALGRDAVRSLRIDVKFGRGVIERADGLYDEIPPRIGADGSETYVFEGASPDGDDPTASPATVSITLSPRPVQMRPADTKMPAEEVDEAPSHSRAPRRPPSWSPRRPRRGPPRPLTRWKAPSPTVTLP
ncbi:hypothetical protein FBZ87_1133 [Nitrospirillum amazonense]|uniref:Uncharacterized protein n=1 Tax=Nitrospirillum amazonense TaxID=28077 RepID=A0A560J989_9PROT|nr:hypothetical protein FBZ87_1133 [Nitrospirillum amazonense]